MQSLSWTVQDENSKSKFMEETMGDFTIEDMLAIQQALQEKYKDKWEPIGPEAGKHKLLWMLGEVGEVIDIIKKNGDQTLFGFCRFLRFPFSTKKQGRPAPSKASSFWQSAGLPCIGYSDYSLLSWGP